MTIKQKSKIVILADGREIEVQRMTWKAGREFMRMLAAQIQILFKEGQLIDMLRKAQVEESKSFELISSILETLPNIIASSEEMLAHLTRNTVKMTPADFDQIDLHDALKCVEASIEINLDDELKNSFGSIVRNVARLMLPARTK